MNGSGWDPKNCLLELSEKLLPAEQRLELLGFLQYCLTKLGDWTDGLGLPFRHFYHWDYQAYLLD